MQLLFLIIYYTTTPTDVFPYKTAYDYGKGECGY